MRGVSLRVLTIVLGVALTSACGVTVVRGRSAGHTTTVDSRRGESPRRVGVPADSRSRSGRGESPPGHARRDDDHGRSRSDRGQSPPGRGHGRGGRDDR
ncbi:hypothetical protein [Sandaracinus amylolyticus]|uniref:hypothetical protein n=1 Tax=Sandaracinus amylolyticus TaxID=927083 RepID=UPI001F2BC39F|nr:hypothetical protein [Sandaracinus amylolyticus]UJR80872.1 Hypothetical protein I5071_29220 [Sandaracinus amylolyticus]